MTTKQLLLCTDLDRTLIPNGPEPESPGARARFKALVEQPQVTLVYVTGRHLALTREAIKLYNLPTPDFIVGDVGSTIYQLHEGQWHHWQAWEDEIASDWNGKGRKDIEALFHGYGELQLQEYTKQNIHKVSYYLPLYIDQQQLLERMEQTLKLEKINASLIFSIDKPAAIGLLDILPERATKRHAIEFLMQQLEFTLEQTLFAGDSGNDIPVLVSPIHAILVANASPKVYAEAQQKASLLNNSLSLYCARGGYLGMNGNYSAGILEGVVHYMPAAEGWLK